MNGRSIPRWLSALALVVLIGAGKPARAQSWADSRTAGPFACYADFSLAGMEAYFQELENLQNELVRTLGIPLAAEPIQLYLFQNETTYRAFLRFHLPQVPYRRALYVKRDGVGRVLVCRGRQLAVDSRHECTHALLHAVLPTVPLWLDEGLAEYFELAPEERAFSNPHLSSVRWNARFGRIPRLSGLERLGDLSEMQGSHYRGAWAWAHFIFHGSSEAHEELVDFLADLRARNLPTFFSQRLSARLPDIERRFSAHFRGWRR